jgi:SAM-dependent methyltransferase
MGLLPLATLTGFIAFLTGVTTTTLLGPGPRLNQAAAARHLLSYLEENDDDDLKKAAECLNRIPRLADDVMANDRQVLFPVGLESAFLRRVVGSLHGKESAKDWADMPQFKALLDHLAKDDHRLLKVHLAEVASATNPTLEGDAAQPLEGDESTTMLMIRTLRPERWNLEHRLTVSFVGLQPGEHVADIGSGAGFFTFRFSAAVGPQGLVHAVDVNPKPLDFIDGAMDLMPFPNVKTSLSTYTENRLGDASVDVVFISNILADVEAYAPDDKAAFYASIKRILRLGGRFVACDHATTWRGLSRAVAVRRIEEAGFRVIDSYGWPSVCIKSQK